MKSMESAPKDKLILLLIPAFGVYEECWWIGTWSWVENRWSVRTPFTYGNKIVFVSNIPRPTGWEELPSKEK